VSSYRQLIDGSVYEWGTYATGVSGSASVALSGSHNLSPVVILTPSGSSANLSIVLVNKDVFMVESSVPDVKFKFYAVSKP